MNAPRRAALAAALLVALSAPVARAEPMAAALVDGALRTEPAVTGAAADMRIAGPQGFTAWGIPGSAWAPPAGAPDGIYTYDIATVSGSLRKVTHAGSFMVEKGRIVLHAERPFRR